ncbi:hypothetical protein QJS10_CPB13g01543 [Acorus calamus]|uniref:Uncharacterized protein n=1 Tax=Acorus calamus TaxID=4465 RepID=A0AAV9DJ13_ACOCL|nr:hypothetical protein QJS10_CPB13g01543 [Acorus calamus]
MKSVLFKLIKQSKKLCCQPRRSIIDDVEKPLPAGHLPVYVGGDRARFIVPVQSLSHPLFRMLLEKTYREYGFEQRCGLVVLCSVSFFREVLRAVECCHGRFQIENLVEELEL